MMIKQIRLLMISAWLNHIRMNVLSGYMSIFSRIKTMNEFSA